MPFSQYTQKMLFKYPPLQIHAWGGLGSQLFAISLAYELKGRYPSRNQLIVLHTGGVTKRSPEVKSLFPEFSYLEVDDFKQRKLGLKRETKMSINAIKKFARVFFLFTGVLAEENDGRTRKVKAWTLSVRGHYLYRKVDKKFLQTLFQRLKDSNKLDVTKNCTETFVHYRLGDLIDLPEKNPIRPERIIEALQLKSQTKFMNVLSDSPQLAAALLNKNSCGLQFYPLDLSTQGALFEATLGNIFLGTSSKISYWIVLLRICSRGESINLIPAEDSNLIKRMIDAEHEITYY